MLMYCCTLNIVLISQACQRTIFRSWQKNRVRFAAFLRMNRDGIGRECEKEREREREKERERAQWGTRTRKGRRLRIELTARPLLRAQFLIPRGAIRVPFPFNEFLVGVESSGDQDRLSFRYT